MVLAGGSGRADFVFHALPGSVCGFRGVGRPPDSLGRSVEWAGVARERKRRTVLLPTGPHVADRRRRVAGTEAAAVPASMIKARPGRPVIMRPIEPVIMLGALARDHLGRTIAGQEAVAVPVLAGVLLLVRRFGRGRGGERKG